jgi:hypothetical protein
MKTIATPGAAGNSSDCAIPRVSDGKCAHNAADRPLILLTLLPEPGVDGTRALRTFLKVALRAFRLRCISAEMRP